MAGLQRQAFTLAADTNNLTAPFGSFMLIH
jgi:hypothetical protein